jgi:hypothetical protein
MREEDHRLFRLIILVLSGIRTFMY